MLSITAFRSMHHTFSITYCDNYYEDSTLREHSAPWGSGEYELKRWKDRGSPNLSYE